MPKCGFLFFFLICSSCAKQGKFELPSAQELRLSVKSSLSVKKLARVITHYHSPYSFDACDKKGIQDGVINAVCLANLRDALCQNRVDMLFLSDHPQHMEDYEMPSLLLLESKDQPVYSGSQLIANQMSGCQNGFSPLIQMGFEGKLLALGMHQHLSSDIAVRKARYNQEDAQLREDLQTITDALVFIPHTESRSLDLIKDIQPDGIEIYNIHANVDPKIRKRDLNENPFSVLSGMATYLVDPYKTLNADYMFLHFFSLPEVNMQKWNTLIGSGMKLTGIPGTDSHENIFPQKAADGQRIDSHRRMTRFVSNHVLVESIDAVSIKAALKKGNSWVVFEGFGSPQNMDFYVTDAAESVFFFPGDTVSNTAAVAVLQIPTLYSKNTLSSAPIKVVAEILQVNPDGSTTSLVSGSSGTLRVTLIHSYPIRAQITITPEHLSDVLGEFAYLTKKSFPWIITNHIYFP